MNLKGLACKLSGLAPKVRLGPLEWDMPQFFRNLLDCETSQKKIISCYRNVFGDIICYTDATKTQLCVVIPQEEANKTSQILMHL